MADHAGSLDRDEARRLLGLSSGAVSPLTRSRRQGARPCGLFFAPHYVLLISSRCNNQKLNIAL
jgi:hypothetical protein